MVQNSEALVVSPRLIHLLNIDLHLAVCPSCPPNHEKCGLFW